MDAGYLVVFTTAGGQTIGKMALGLRVVRDDDEAVPVGTALMRSLGAIASTLCLGPGLLPALLHEDRRAVHDRLSGTHVVRFPAGCGPSSNRADSATPFYLTLSSLLSLF